jgi:hypothetical protein
MAESFNKVKNKVRRSLDRTSRDQPNSPDGRYTDYLSNKPLPSSPEHHVGTSQPTIRQVNAFGPESNVHNVNTTSTGAAGTDKISNQHLLPELDFNRLNIEDPDDEFDDVEEGLPAKSIARRDKKSSQSVSKTSHTLPLNPTDPDESSSKIKSDPTAVSSIIPDRRSSKKFEPHDAGAGSYISPSRPSAEGAVRRKRLSPQAQLAPGLDLVNTVDTSTETTQAPAVTHEVVHKQTTEIVHEKITRDIHVDHYYNYVQPIKEVVIKPAVHFTINESGEKVRIATPDCWQPPPGFTPTPEDKDREATLGETFRSIRKAYPHSTQETEFTADGDFPPPPGLKGKKS